MKEKRGEDVGWGGVEVCWVETHLSPYYHACSDYYIGKYL